MSSLLPSHPGIELNYSNPANDVNGVQGYVMLEQMQTSLIVVPMSHLWQLAILQVTESNRANELCRGQKKKQILD